MSLPAKAHSATPAMRIKQNACCFPVESSRRVIFGPHCIRKVCFCLLLPLCFPACAIPYRVNYARYFSPLRKEVVAWPEEAKLRNAILEVIPLGTPRQVVEQRIRKNFSASIAVDDRKMTLRAFPKSDSNDISICIPTYEKDLFPWGLDIDKAHFLFDVRGRLLDVGIVHQADWV